MPRYRCAEYGCNTDVYYKANTPQRYCESHRCTTDACQNARNPASRFCADHLECLKTGCHELRLHPNSDEQDAPYCAEHWWTCHVFDCKAWADFQSEFCKAHHCHFPGCENPPSAGLQFCGETHMCNFGQCVEPNQEGLYACLKHACQIPGCPFVVEDGRKACSSHVCRLTAFTCNEIGAFTTQGRQYCYTHTCNVYGCLNLRKQSGSMFLEHCSNHGCVAPNCVAIQEYAQGRNHCSQHAVCGKLGCGYSRLVQERFCSLHWSSCKKLDCFSDRHHGEYCTQHACAERGCSLARQEHRTHCDQHQTCAAQGCTTVCTLPQEACRNHKCDVESCVRAVYLDGSYCRDRKLKRISFTLLTRCLRAVDVCVKAGCFRPQDRVFDYSCPHTFCRRHRPMPSPPHYWPGDRW